MLQKDADEIASSVDPDQTVPSSLIWVCTVCPDISVQKHKLGSLQYASHWVGLQSEYSIF